MMHTIKNHWHIFSIICFGTFLRFFNPLWDNGLFLHPDERLFVNASHLSLPTSWQQFFSVSSPLNPHMFYYGTVLLYLYKLLSLISPFSLLMTSRMVSAMFSVLTLPFLYLLAKELFTKKIAILSSFVFVFAVGSIQYAHFNTTESALIFFLTLITYLDVLCVKKEKPHLLGVSFFLVSIAAAIKITGLVFGLSPVFAFVLLIRKPTFWRKTVFWAAFGIVVGALVYGAFSPYQFLDAQEFTAQNTYMQAVTYGQFKPPFVIIYEGTPAYLYQLLHVFPFTFGFVSFPLCLAGLFLLLGKIAKKNERHISLLFALVFPIAYFAWSGSWYAKYARYALLLFPFLALWAGYMLAKIKPWVMALCLFGICLNGLLFFRIYLGENTRVVASEWMYAHIPADSTIATEYWDDALPLRLPDQTKQFRTVTLSLYDPDSLQKMQSLAQALSASDYLSLSSRRVMASILQNKATYPLTTNYYHKLFAGQLGFTKVYTQTMYPFFFSDDAADETFQSYDHPPVVLFANTQHFAPDKIFSLLLQH